MTGVDGFTELGRLVVIFLHAILLTKESMLKRVIDTVMACPTFYLPG